MVAPEPGEVLGPKALRGMFPHANRSARGREDAAQDGKQSGLAATGRPHQKRQFAARKGKAYALEGRHSPCPAAEKFYDIDGFDHRPRHRVNTMAGSMRMTFAMAPTAESTHMTRVSTNSPNVSCGVITIGKAVSAVFLTMKNPMPAAMQNPMTALSTACQMITL